MDKNVGSVDLDELRKAREELNKEIGVESDPNMYSDYNPNRKSEEPVSSKTEESFEDSYENKTDVIQEESSDPDFRNSVILENSIPDDGESSVESEINQEIGASEKNLDKYDIFSAFEVAENVHAHSESFDQIRTEKTTNIENIEDELTKVIDNEKPSSEEDNLNLSENSISNLENAEELDKILDKLLDDLDEEYNSLESIDNNEVQVAEQDEEIKRTSVENIADDYLSSLGVDSEVDEIDSISSKIEEDNESASEVLDDESEETDSVKDDHLSLFMKGALNTSNDDETDEGNESSENGEFSSDSGLDDVISSVSLENEESTDEIETKPEEVSEIESDEQSQDDVNVDEVEEVAEIESEDEKEEISEELEDKNIRDNSVEIDAYDASKARPVENTTLQNSAAYDGETAVITDYSQLRDILQKELKESELAAKARVEEEDDGVKYALIEDFKFIDEIATDEFKDSDKFSYIMGKNEKGEMIYGNFREHFNLAVFGKNETVTNSFLNSMILSLCLKNGTEDVNFVMLDSDINSSFEVYNKSSYLYFNRIAKTNKEILDTLIEITKELDARYEKFAAAGLNNIEQFNDIAKETETTPMPYLIVVFNNYTSASQATYIDKINACLYQILKFGRIVGIYAVVTAMLPIETNQVNYNLSSRLSFKSDGDSKYTVGVEDVSRLPDENDAMYFNISKNTTVHLKTATVTETELDLIIKELEE